MVGRGHIPNDPGRKERILDATVAVIAELGTDGTTHRRIAERASVPMGSLTYYFSGLDDILEQAFLRFAEQASKQFQELMNAAADRDQAVEAIADLICGAEGVQHNLPVVWSMYLFADRSEATALVARNWLRQSRAGLRLHFAESRCLVIDALIEGWLIHARFEPSRPERETVVAAVRILAE
uniref:TetR/AcrR family transcriptional regulator n=1 Tax=Rhodococcus qingshengii TaxID=334542 RepID=UPI001C4E0BB0|nr:TetR family transcriptional regulator [Rhodococcus qingshengii]